jgi:hypothetical protein
MLIQPVPTICILLKDYYDIEKIEALKAKIAKLPDFRFFISPQYTDEPKYDIYVVSNSPAKMLLTLQVSSFSDDIEDIRVQSI